MTRDLPLPVRDLAQQQHGVLSREQLTQAGLTDEMILGRVRRGSWQRLHCGVYAVFSGPPSRQSMAWAAVLYAGPGAVLSHQTAAEFCGLADKLHQAIHVTVPGDRRVAPQPGIVLHLSARAAQAVHPARTPPQTRIEETVLDLWQTARGLDEAIGWLTASLGRRLTTEDKLRTALADRSRIRWRRQLTELLSPDAAGQHSILEHRYVRDVERPHHLPRATRQAVARRDGRTEYRDALYEEYQTAVELDGQLAHPAETRWLDIRRDNAAAVSGLTTLRYGWAEVTTRPCVVAAEVAAVLARRGEATPAPGLARPDARYGELPGGAGPRPSQFRSGGPPPVLARVRLWALGSARLSALASARPPGSSQLKG